MSELEDIKEPEQEEAKQEEAPTTVDLSAVEEAASKQGWKPDGDLDALAFLSKGSVFRDGLHKEIAELKEDNAKVYGIVADHIHNTQTKDHETTKLSIEDQIRAASESGETDKVIELSRQLAESKAPEKPADPKDAYIDKWVGDNKWFDSNQEMGDEAKALYLVEEGKGETDPKVILPRVEAKIKERYASHFKPENPNRKRASASDGDGGKATKKSSSGLKLADLDEDERKHFDQYIEMGMKEESLLKSIQDGRTARGV